MSVKSVRFRQEWVSVCSEIYAHGSWIKGVSMLRNIQSACLTGQSISNSAFYYTVNFFFEEVFIFLSLFWRINSLIFFSSSLVNDEPCIPIKSTSNSGFLVFIALNLRNIGSLALMRHLYQLSLTCLRNESHLDFQHNG